MPGRTVAFYVTIWLNLLCICSSRLHLIYGIVRAFRFDFLLTVYSYYNDHSRLFAEDAFDLPSSGGDTVADGAPSKALKD
jgi:hypothetical protein